MYKLYALDRDQKMIPVLENTEEVIDEQVKLCINDNILVWKVYVNEEN